MQTVAPARTPMKSGVPRVGSGAPSRIRIDGFVDDWREPPRVRQAVTLMNLTHSEPLVGIAFLTRPFHPRKAERHNSKAPKGAFLLRDRYCGPADPSECWKGRGGRGWIGGATAAAVHANFPVPYFARP